MYSHSSCLIVGELLVLQPWFSSILGPYAQTNDASATHSLCTASLAAFAINAPHPDSVVSNTICNLFLCTREEVVANVTELK